MPINAIHGYNKSDGTDKLIIQEGTHLRIYNSSTGAYTDQSISLTTAGYTPNFVNFLDYAFYCDGVNSNRTYNGSTWSTSTLLGDCPRFAYIQTQGVRIFGAHPQILSTTYKSRVWYSDLPEQVTSGGLSWGIETGSNLSQTASSAVVTSSGSTFETNNIKIGDPFYITTGDNAGKYTVQSIDSETQITLTEDLSSNATNSSFWVGRNWFDVKTNDGDIIMGLADNFNELFIFKRNSLHRYNQSGNELRQVRGSLGTTSYKSILTLGDYVYFYHPLGGIMRCNGTSSTTISNAVEDIVEGVASTYVDKVVLFSEEDKYVIAFLGDITTRDGETITNCAVVLNTETNQWDVRSYPFAINSATLWTQNNVPARYIGTGPSLKVYKVPDTYAFAGSAIAMRVQTYPIYPAGEDAIIDFKRLRLYMSNPTNVIIKYKLIYKPSSLTQWINDNEWKALSGNVEGERSEFEFPLGERASGVELMFLESSTVQEPVIEKVLLYYSNPADI